VVALWLGCRCCRLSVSTICGRIMIGLSLLSSVSKPNMWSYYNNDNPIIIQPHIVFTDGRLQRQLNHNTTTYCAYWRKTTTLGCRCCRQLVNTICGRIMIGLLSSVSKHNMWSYYDWVVVLVNNPIIIRPHIVFTNWRQQRQPNHNTTTYCVYRRKTTTTQS
jgi:hypothetical protein